MKHFLIIACVAVAATTFAYDLTDSPLRAEVLELLKESGGIRSRIMALPAEKNKAMLDYVRLQQSRDVAKDFDYQSVLLCLGDEATYQDLLKKKDFGSLQDTLDPHAFELIAPEMFGDLTPRGPRIYSYSTYARSAIVHMLWQMPEVPPRIKAWLETFRDTDLSNEESQQIFRDWWTANEDAWRRRNFAVLKAGPDMSHRNIPKRRAAKRAEEAAAAAAAGTSATTPAQQTAAPAVQPLFAEPSKTSWVRVAALGALILSFVLGIGAWRAAHKGRR